LNFTYRLYAESKAPDTAPIPKINPTIFFLKLVGCLPFSRSLSLIVSPTLVLAVLRSDNAR
jgi:hypothetical protein